MTIEVCEVVENQKGVVCIRCGSSNLFSFANKETGRAAFYICRDCRRIFTPTDIAPQEG